MAKHRVFTEPVNSRVAIDARRPDLNAERREAGVKSLAEARRYLYAASQSSHGPPLKELMVALDHIKSALEVLTGEEM